jgi:transposase, IS5 family
MLLQAWYGLSDPELEFQCLDRLSFRNFLGFPGQIPDFTTIWKIRDRLKESKVDEKIWDELQRQLDSKGYTIKKGVFQDACFIEADQGKKRIQQEKRTRRHGTSVEYTKKQLQHIDKDGGYGVKNGRSITGTSHTSRSMSIIISSVASI